MVVEEGGDGRLEEIAEEGARGCVGACRVPDVAIEMHGVCRLLGIQGFVGEGGHGLGRLLGGLLYRVGTWLGVAVCAVGYGGSVG